MNFLCGISDGVFYFGLVIAGSIFVGLRFWHINDQKSTGFTIGVSKG
jgi:hypothetical protein